MGDAWGADEGAGWGASGGDGGWGDSGGDAAESKPRNKGCFNCGQEGHRKDECPEPPKERKPRGCFNCGEEGHSKADCPNPAKEGGDGERKKGCFKCGSEEHRAADCEKPDTCRKCGEEGHISKDCEKGFVTQKKTKEDGQVVEYYVPAEADEDKLFAAGITQGINFDKYDKIEVRTTGENAPGPIKTFEDANLRKLIMENVLKSGYKKPTPIQRHGISTILAKRDLMACAQTGSGKTAAFLLPILHQLLEDGAETNAGECPQKPQAVIVAPTRELAIQIKDEARKFCLGSVLKCVVAYGGTSSMFQLSTLFKGCNVLICTPGRLMDFVDKGKISFEDVKYLVLDEADRMLDMGFLPEVQRICNSAGMPKKGERTTLMFSATFSDEVQLLAKDLLENYIFKVVGMVGGACDDVTQVVWEVDKFAKREKLVEILKDVGTDRTMVFCETKKNADFLAGYLCGEGLPSTSIHGDRLQREREEALGDFKSGKFPIIVCTGVASRGLDIKDVKHVINYDMPKEVDEYVHRIGRTGRVGNTGKATSFFDSSRQEDTGIASALVTILAKAQQEVPDFLAAHASGGGGGLDGGAFGATDVRGGEPADDEW